MTWLLKWCAAPLQIKRPSRKSAPCYRRDFSFLLLFYRSKRFVTDFTRIDVSGSYPLAFSNAPAAAKWDSPPGNGRIHITESPLRPRCTGSGSHREPSCQHNRDRRPVRNYLRSAFLVRLPVGPERIVAVAPPRTMRFEPEITIEKFKSL